MCVVPGQLSRAALPITTEAGWPQHTVCTVASVQYTAYRVQAAGCPRQQPCYYYVSGFSLTVSWAGGHRPASAAAARREGPTTQRL